MVPIDENVSKVVDPVSLDLCHVLRQFIRVLDESEWLVQVFKGGSSLSTSSGIDKHGKIVHQVSVFGSGDVLSRNGQPTIPFLLQYTVAYALGGVGCGG